MGGEAASALPTAPTTHRTHHPSPTTHHPSPTAASSLSQSNPLHQPFVPRCHRVPLACTGLGGSCTPRTPRLPLARLRHRGHGDHAGPRRCSISRLRQQPQLSPPPRAAAAPGAPRDLKQTSLLSPAPADRPGDPRPQQTHPREHQADTAPGADTDTRGDIHGGDSGTGDRCSLSTHVRPPSSSHDAPMAPAQRLLPHAHAHACTCTRMFCAHACHSLWTNVEP